MVAPKALISADTFRWLLPIATAIGAWGGFPQAPQFFKDLTQNEIFQYLMVFILVWQGGGQQDVTTSLIVTVGMFIVAKMLSGGFGFQTCPTPPPPAASTVTI